MKEELLLEMKAEAERMKERYRQHNENVKRIRQLEKDPAVKEYLQLMETFNCEPQYIKKSLDEIIASNYSKHLYHIKQGDTNGIYVFLGTYRYNREIDIVHGSTDYRVADNDPKADYRLYHDLEHHFPEQVVISRCEQFERDHIVIMPNTLSDSEYYKIQREFFVKAVKTDQEKAKKMILRKYPRITDK